MRVSPSAIWVFLSIFIAVGRGQDASVCAQADVIVPVKNEPLWTAVNNVISTPEFGNQAVKWLSEAIQVETVSFDNMGPVTEDPRWENRAAFADYLASAFPLVHSTLTVEKVNTYGLLYTWEGSNTALKPLLLLGHQDVVPIDPATASQWTHPPFSGHFDGTKIWGRGSIDDKSGLIGSLSAVELLIKEGLEQPERGVILAFGFDEEIGGTRGAGTISPRLIEKYGKDSIALVVDEGGGFGEQFGSIFAAPGIAEKGSFNLQINVSTPGGHSSVPPEHTGIGILSAIITELENNPFTPHLVRGAPPYLGLQCTAEHGAAVEPSLRQLIQDSVESDEALAELEKIAFQDRVTKSLAGTTQAADMIGGGIKSNALPEQSWAVINHRVAIESSVNATKDRDTNLITPLASKFNVTFNAFGTNISGPFPSNGHVAIFTPATLNPAPITPVEGNGYKVLSGAIKSAYNVHRGLDSGEGSPIIVTPGMPSGNTDTRFYWDLSPHIFRYNHVNVGIGTNTLAKGVHTVNEALELDAFLEIIRFFTTLILIVDESTEV